MKLLRLALFTVASIAMLIVAAGTAHGAPTPGAPTQRTTASADGTSITTVLQHATFVAAADGGLSVVDHSGRLVDRVAPWVPLNGARIPLRATVSADRTSATFHPLITPGARDLIARGMHPAATKKDRAYQKMIWHINNGWNRGGGVATAVGAIAGLIVGCLVIVGCIWGAGVGAAIGAAVGINSGDPQAGQAILTWINTP
ncbi:hypothetical protein AAFP30_21780 [Gordonia sp. CPCC 205515]|uniref:hypothetical protein n=1 Tax=Gordonia sp. CPCC 205515 TaxID=3140791 RepID=UPI003AF3F167